MSKKIKFTSLKSLNLSNNILQARIKTNKTTVSPNFLKLLEKVNKQYGLALKKLSKI